MTSFGSNPSVGKYIKVNDITMYYEVYGEGEPLVLLHGGGGSIENFEYQIPELSEYFRIIAVDSRAQGRTTDSEQELSYALMASDIAELLKKLQLDDAYILGWSDGGDTGLELAYSHPELVRKLVISGSDYNHLNPSAPDDGIRMDQEDPVILKTKAFLKKFRENPEKLSPYPERVPAIREKLRKMWNNFPDFSIDQLKTINIPVLVIAGDHDIATLEQTITLFKSLPKAQLFIVPGTSHLTFMEQPELMNQQIIKFLLTPFRELNNRYYFK
jgi:pimeloyl-ACP methyl ester carboxylesterase